MTLDPPEQSAEKCPFLQKNAFSCRKHALSCRTTRFSRGTLQEIAGIAGGFQSSRIKNASQLSQEIEIKQCCRPARMPPAHVFVPICCTLDTWPAPPSPPSPQAALQQHQSFPRICREPQFSRRRGVRERRRPHQIFELG